MKMEFSSQKKDTFVLDLQHGRRDVTSKTAIEYMYQEKFRRYIF